MPVASVIIPVYNSEKYIGRCLDSILSQADQDFEIILVDDGSSDSSLDIMRKYKERFEDRIVIISQKNAGAGQARNIGIGQASGKYLFFVDNDDYIDADYIKTFVRAAEASRVDMVIGGYKRVNETGKYIFCDKTKADAEWEPFKRLAPWGRIYRRDFIVKNNLKFLNNIVGEDTYFNVLAAVAAAKTEVIGYNGYNWFFNSQSISNTQHVDPKIEDAVLYMLKEIYSALDIPSLESRKAAFVEYFYIKTLVFYLLFFGRKFDYKRLINAYDLWFSQLHDWFPNYRKNRFIGLRKPKGEYIKTRLTVACFTAFERVGLIKVFLKLYH